jgi:hypothetical protein
LDAHIGRHLEDIDELPVWRECDMARIVGHRFGDAARFLPL